MSTKGELNSLGANVTFVMDFTFFRASPILRIGFLDRTTENKDIQKLFDLEPSARYYLAKNSLHFKHTTGAWSPCVCVVLHMYKKIQQLYVDKPPLLIKPLGKYC